MKRCLLCQSLWSFCNIAYYVHPVTDYQTCLMKVWDTSWQTLDLMCGWEMSVATLMVKTWEIKTKAIKVLGLQVYMLIYRWKSWLCFFRKFECREDIHYETHYYGPHKPGPSGWESNPHPLDYQTSPLPLSYRSCCRQLGCAFSIYINEMVMPVKYKGILI